MTSQEQSSQPETTSENLPAVSETKKFDLNELLRVKAEEMTEDHIKQLIEFYRNDRTKYIELQKIKESKPKESKPKSLELTSDAPIGETVKRGRPKGSTKKDTKGLLAALDINDI